MHQKLEAGSYKSLKQFQDDFDLLIRNALTYYPITSPLRAKALKLQKIGLKLIQRQFEAIGLGDLDEEDVEGEENEDNLQLYEEVIYYYY